MTRANMTGPMGAGRMMPSGIMGAVGRVTPARLAMALLLSALCAGGARAQSLSVADPPTAPASVKLRFDGRFRAYMGWYGDSAFDLPITDYTGRTLGTNRQSGFGLNELVRLYPGFDGVTASGWTYGASIELRQDNFDPPGGGTNGSTSAANRARGAVYVRRQWGYLGSPSWGSLRFGTQGGPAALFLTGTMQNFNDGGFNGDAQRGLAANAQIPWPFADVDDIGQGDKLVYLSPALDTGATGRFDGGISFEPGTGGVSFNDGNCPAAIAAPGYGCDRLSSSVDAAESARRRDTIEVALRWRAVIGAVGLAAQVAYIGGGHVNYDGPAVTGNLLTTPVYYQRQIGYSGLSVGDIGLAATYAGVQVGANVQHGRYNSSDALGNGATLALLPKGGKNATAWIAGASYSLGPAVLGASYLSQDSQGAFLPQGGTSAEAALSAPSVLGRRHETGVAAGGTLKLVPGVAMFLSYLHGEREQANYDFVTGRAGATTHNAVGADVLTLGTSLTW